MPSKISKLKELLSKQININPKNESQEKGDNSKRKGNNLKGEGLKKRINGYITTTFVTNGKCISFPSKTSQNEVFSLTNFSGSNGFIVLLPSITILFTDSRYTIQAESEVFNDVIVININYETKVKNVQSTIKNFYDKNSVYSIKYNPYFFSAKTISKYSKYIEKLGIKHEMTSLDEDGIEIVQACIYPQKYEVKSKPQIKFFTLGDKVSGLSVKVKLKKLRQSSDADFILITNPESICWILNIRSLRTDIVQNAPTIYGYLLLGVREDYGIFFSDNAKELTDCDGFESVKLLLSNNNIRVSDFSEIINYCNNLFSKNYTIQSNYDDLPIGIYNKWKVHHQKFLNFKDLCIQWKAVKNKLEINNIKKIHINDALAWYKFLKFLYDKIGNSEVVNEFELAEKFLEFRKLDTAFECLSFSTISSYAQNGAIIHYTPRNTTSCTTFKTGSQNTDSNPIYLIDTGGQYMYGTSDVTRVVPVGKVTKEHQRIYTTVLKSHILLASAKFPKNTNGAQLDAIARYHIWKMCMDYEHSTGHGVGHFLAVHEDFHAISNNNNIPLKAGMIISIEPGVYLKGKYGIRIENLYLISEVKEDHTFLYFQPLTLVPINTQLIDFNGITPEEKLWLEKYHERIYKSLKKYLDIAELPLLRSMLKVY